MPVPDHVRRFVQEVFPKRQRSKAPSRNPYQDAFEEGLANRNKIIKTERQLREDEGRRLRGGL